MPDYVIRLLSLADGSDHEFAGKYLRFYDPAQTGFDETGHPWCVLEVTENIQAAQRFRDPTEAAREYRRSFGIREDGRPNRPLTAFHIEILPVGPAN